MIKIRVKIGNEWYWMVVKNYSVSYVKELKYRVEENGTEKILVVPAEPRKPYTLPIV